MVAHRLPHPQQIFEITFDFGLGAGSAGGAKDHAHALGNLEFFGNALETAAILRICDLARNAAAALDAIDRFASPRAQMYRTPAGWQSIPAQEMLRRVAGLSKALAALGIVSGDRVGLFAPNCPEWHTADFAIQGLGAVNVPIYFNESHDRLIYILNDSGARVVFTAEPRRQKRFPSAAAEFQPLNM